jgi:hypothetical protein
MELQGSLRRSQDPATGFYPEPEESTRHHHIHHVHLRLTLILSSHLRLCPPSGLVVSGFRTKFLYIAVIYPMRAVCLAHLILLHLITLIICGEY